MEPTMEFVNTETCHANAAECRRLAKRVSDQSQKIMLLHMAEIWDQLALTYEGNKV
jgi:hypothetical protein